MFWDLNEQLLTGSGRSSSLAREMCVRCHGRLPWTNCHEQADLEKSFFGNGQGEAIEFGADQCTAFCCDVSFCTNPFHSGILVRNDTTKDKLRQRIGGSLIMSDLIFLHQPFT